MRTAVLSDVHSNLEALRAVLEDSPYDRILVLGDLVGYNADPDAVLTELRDAGATLIAGNHDLAVAGRFDVQWFNDVAASVVRWTAERLDPRLLDHLSTLEPIAWSEGQLLVHGSVCEPATEYLRDTGSAAASFAAAEFELCLHGHTHIPAAFESRGGKVVELEVEGDRSSIEFVPGRRYLLNPGSVGQPRDGDRRASYLIIEDGRAEWRRVEYDVATTMRKVRDAGLPEVLAARLEVGR